MKRDTKQIGTKKVKCFGKKRPKPDLKNTKKTKPFVHKNKLKNTKNSKTFVQKNKNNLKNAIVSKTFVQKNKLKKTQKNQNICSTKNKLKNAKNTKKSTFE